MTGNKNLISENKLTEIIISGCKLYNENKINNAHSKWEKIWKDGSKAQKNTIKGLIQVSGATLQFERKKIDSVLYLFKLSANNLLVSYNLCTIIDVDSLILDLKKIIIKLENNNLKELKINIKF